MSSPSSVHSSYQEPLESSINKRIGSNCYVPIWFQPLYIKTDTKNKNKLYDVEIVEEKGSEVKIHYYSYSSKYDEQKPKVDDVAPPFQPHEEEFSLLTHLACCIKKGLLPSWSGDPVCIQVTRNIPLFHVLQEVAKPLRGGVTDQYKILHYSDLDNVLGKKWWWMKQVISRMWF